MIGRTFVFGVVCLVASQGVNLTRIKRQDDPRQVGRTLDRIFNITGLGQAGNAANTFDPDGSSTFLHAIQNAVSNLQTTSAQRDQRIARLQRMRDERIKRMTADRERKRLEREQIRQERLKQQRMKTTVLYNKDPFGLNALSNLLAGYGGHNGHGSHGAYGDHGNAMGSDQHTYEVHENVNEDPIRNKIAPKVGKPNQYNYDDSLMQNKLLQRQPGRIKFAYEEDPPPRNKIAPKTNRITFLS